MDTETTQTQKSPKLLDSAELSFLPLQPATKADSVLTILWADNFDKVFFSFTTRNDSKKIPFHLILATLATKIVFAWRLGNGCYWLKENMIIP